MEHRFQKNQLSGQLKDLLSNPSTVWEAVRPQAGLAPASMEQCYRGRALQDLAGQLIGITKVKTQPNKNSPRGGLAATKTAGEADNHDG